MASRYLKVMNKIVRIHKNREGWYALKPADTHYPFDQFLRKFLLAYFEANPHELETYRVRVAGNTALNRMVSATSPVDVPTPAISRWESCNFPGILEMCSSTTITIPQE